MAPERFQRARELFEQALELSETESWAFVTRQCGDDRELAATVRGLLERTRREQAEHARNTTPAAADRLIGAQIGPYRIRGVLGQGGMGAVYEAEHERTTQTVALKLIRPGLATPALLRRFEFELQVLARLEHPGIARIYHADTADLGGGPQPYFAMELVRGQNVMRYATERKLGIRQRLELAARIVDAVQYAHQQGVIHRDLKPGNIFVTSEGQPKILDFGVARATDADVQSTTLQTDVGQLIGTLAYMSPEQAGGDPAQIDTRSDVYALGVVTYEMLTGRLPHLLEGRMIHEAARIIREEEPTRLSQASTGGTGAFARQLRGDVETIVGKALDKEKERRYQTANALAADIRRYLNDEPIAARPPSAMYQLAKFARRNKVLVGGVAATFVALTAGLATSIVLYQRAEAQAERAMTAEARERGERERADRQRRSAELVADEMAAMLTGVKASVALGRDTKMLREMLDAVAERIEEGKLKDSPEAELRLRWTVGLAYTDIAADGAAARAEKILMPTLELAERTYGAESAEYATSLDSVAYCLDSLGRSAEALPRHEAALEMSQRLFKGDQPAVASSLNNVAYCLNSLGRSTEALPKFEAALEMRQRLFQGDHAEVATSLNNVACCLNSLGRSAEALPRYEAALEMRQRLFRSDQPAVASSLNNVAGCLQSLGRSAEALPRYEAALEMRQRLFQGDHPDVANSLNNVAGCLESLGRSAEALPKLETALEMRQRLFQGDHPNVAASLNNVAVCLASLGRLAEALPRYEAALEMYQRAFPAGHPLALHPQLGLARTLVKLGRFTEAEPLLTDAAEQCERSAASRRMHWRAVLKASVELYDAWHTAEPDKGYDAKAAEWRTKLEEWQASTQPAATQPGNAL